MIEYPLDLLIGEKLGPIILAGECAFQRCGITTLYSPTVQAWTLAKQLHDIPCTLVHWYFNPKAKFFEDTEIGSYHGNLYEPTTERAIIEYIIFHDYFDEGILIEGLQTYHDMMDGNWKPVVNLLDKYHCPFDWFKYWTTEAMEDWGYSFNDIKF